MKVEIVLTTISNGKIVEEVVADGSIAYTGTTAERFLAYHAKRLFTAGFTMRPDQNVFGWVAVDANGNTLTVR